MVGHPSSLFLSIDDGGGRVRHIDDRAIRLFIWWFVLLGRITSDRRCSRHRGVILRFFPGCFRHPPRLRVSINRNSIRLLDGLFMTFILMTTTFRGTPHGFQRPTSNVQLATQSDVIYVSSAGDISKARTTGS